MKPIPNDVAKWLGYGNEPWSLETHPVEAIEGISIITGTVGNEMGSDVRAFAEENTTKDYLIVNVDTERENTWGDIAIAFETEAHAETFEQLVRENNGSLRLSSGDYNGWFCFEAE